LLDGIIRYYFDKNFFLFFLFSLFYANFNRLTIVKNFSSFILLLTSIPLIIKSIGFFKTSIVSVTKFSNEKFKIIIESYLLSHLIFAIFELIVPSSILKKIFFTSLYFKLPLGIEGDSNYSLAVILFSLLILKHFYTKFNSFTFWVLVISSLLLFRSSGALLAFVFFYIFRLKLLRKRILYVLFILISLISFYVFMLHLGESPKEVKIYFANLTTYRTDIWLYILGADPGIYNLETASEKQPHNFFIQCISYGWFGVLFLFFLLFKFLLIDKKFIPFIIFWFISSFSLNSGSSAIFLVLIFLLNSNPPIIKGYSI
jgi:hypothetical protein